MKAEEFQFCPKCGAALKAPAEGQAPEIPGTVLCAACGSTFQPADVAVPISPAAPSRGSRNPLTLFVVALIAAAMLYFGFHSARRSAQAAGPAPDFTLETLDGKKMTLSDLRGKAVLLNFWATWCGPCKIETPWLVEMQNQYGAQGLQVVGVAMDDSSKEDIEKFAKDMGMNYPILLGKESVGDQYGGIPALPETFFIGRDGMIVDKIIGLKGRAEIEDSVKKALDTRASNTVRQYSVVAENEPVRK